MTENTEEISCDTSEQSTKKFSGTLDLTKCGTINDDRYDICYCGSSVCLHFKFYYKCISFSLYWYIC